MIREDIFEFGKSGKCRRGHGKGHKEGKLPRKSSNYLNHSACFSKSQPYALNMSVQYQRTCNGIISGTVIVQWETQK
jgi:hypothetical protein